MNKEKGNQQIIDVTAPGKKVEQGNLHILTKTFQEIEEIFTRMGFEIADGPEVDTEENTWDKLNIPRNHPARDMQDSFWVKNLIETILRPHTSNVQIRYMEGRKPPIRIIVPGRVFRNESIDATHEAQFHQLEGLMIGENISLANLKSVLNNFLKKLFNDNNLKIRIRPGYFPFVEPGIEVDMNCHKCKKNLKKTCSVCKGSGWIEILGAGMVHPNVLQAVKIDSKKYQGFAFGIGIERIVMLKYGIDDIRDFYDGDIPFLKQF